MERRALVIDANILIRAVLGQRVRLILSANADNISFFISETVVLYRDAPLSSEAYQSCGSALLPSTEGLFSHLPASSKAQARRSVVSDSNVMTCIKRGLDIANEKALWKAPRNKEKNQ